MITETMNYDNNSLINMCQQQNIKVVSHTNTIDLAKYLNESQFHLNKYETIEFVTTFKKFFYNLNWQDLDNSEGFEQYETNFPNFIRNTLHSDYNKK